MTTYMTSDTHFGHKNIIRLSNRPFKDVDEMNEAMISNFNDQAEPDATIYHFGDACMGKLDESLPLISLIEAKVILVPGNHDRMSKAYHHKGDAAAQRERRERERERYLEYFDEVLPDERDLTLELQGVKFAISHYPYSGDHFTDDRFPELRPKNYGLPLLHGHVHELWKFNGPQFNVGVDVNDFKLVHENEAVAWAKSLTKDDKAVQVN